MRDIINKIKALENASCGATSSGAVATVNAPVSSVQKRVKEDGQFRGMREFSTLEDFTDAATAAELNVVSDSHADVENGPHPDDLVYNLWAIDGTDLEDSNSYGMFSFDDNGENGYGVLFTDSNTFTQWLHQEDSNTDFSRDGLTEGGSEPILKIDEDMQLEAIKRLLK